MATTIGSTTQKTLLTDRFIKGLKPAPAGKRVVYWDTIVPGFAVRVSDRADATGKATGLSFIVMRRRPGQAQPIRHTIGRYHPDALPLAKAREEARKALGEIAAGKKPVEEKRRQQREEADRQASTVSALADDFIEDMQRRKLRNVREFEAIIRREFLGQVFKDGGWVNSRERGWRDRPLSDITPQDAAKLIRGITNRGGDPQLGQRRRKSGGEWAAHHALAMAKTMFGWAVDQLTYGLATSPFERLKPKRIIGQKKPRQRVLDDAEIRAVWKAAERVGGAYGDLVRLLALTGQRLSQVAEMQRGEVDLDKALWVTPAEKMKMAKPHATPLSSAAVALLRDRLRAPSHRNGFLFSTTGGARPISGFSKFKRRLDGVVEDIRSERATEAGDAIPDPMPDWVLHDLRRTVRTELPKLRVPDVVAEAVLAHARPGIAATYDLYGYLNEKRDALDRWAAHLATILTPAPDNVLPMREKAQA